MARRSRALRIDDHRLRDAHHLSRSSRPHHRDRVVLEDSFAIQVREIQSLLEENQRLASAHLTLKHELAAAKRELHRVSTQAVDAKAESDARVRELYKRSMEMEGEVREVDEMSAALTQVRADVQTLAAARQELAEQLQSVDDNIARARSELRKLPTIKAEIESMRKEIQRGRAAIELEKKTRAHNFEQRQLMERTTISMAREIERLHAELAEEKRARAAAASAKAADASTGYAASYNNPGVAYRGKSYHDPYGTDQVRGDADVGPHSGCETTPHGTDDSRRTHVYR